MMDSFLSVACELLERGSGSKSLTFTASGAMVQASLEWRVDDAKKDALLVLSLDALLGGVGYANFLELPCTCSEERLAEVVEGFALSLTSKPFCDYAPIDRDAPMVDSFEIEGVLLQQPMTMIQWHPNACGYRALFNAMCLANDWTLMSTEPRYWSEVLHWLRILERSNKESNLWSLSGLRSVTLDQMQMRFLVNSDPRLFDKVDVYGSQEELEKNTVSFPKALVLGCVTHWAAASIASARVQFAESFRKPCFQFLSETESELTPQDVAEKVMEDYRPRFLRKLRRSHATYEHMPEEMLEDFYINGVPEYWKGKEKSSLWWLHRPYEVRVMLLIKEMESCAAMLHHLFNLTMSESASTTSEKVCLLEEYMLLSPPLSESLFDSIRRDEDWPEDSPQYKAGRTIAHRKKPPRPEIPGDIFDRQRVIVDFDQALIERQTCLIFGTGGVGQNTALTLARLGVKCIILLDFDDVEPSNLTRQCLSSLEDLRKQKVEAAAANLKSQHSLRSQIITFDGDILDNWGMILALVQNCTALFNCADIGVMFDYCLNSLAKRFRIPIATGQSFAWKFMTEFYAGQPNSHCAFCQENTESSFGLRNMDFVFMRFESFVADKPITTDLVLDFFEKDTQFRMKGKEIKKIIKSMLQSQQIRTTKESFEHFLKQLHNKIIKAISPRCIHELKGLGLIPRPVLPETRFFGSWVCPCLAAGVFMVSQWSNFLTSPTRRDPPTHIVFNLDEGMTSEEQMSYELGMGLAKEDRTFARSTPCEDFCAICSDGKLLDEERKLFFGSRPVFLTPVRGKIFPVPFYAEEHGNLEPRTEKPLGLVEPGIPAWEPAVLPLPEIFDEHVAPQELLTCPLLKSPAEAALTEPSSLLATASGVRSAVVHVRNRAFRLKGCGNNTDGFVIEKHGDHGEEMIRGCLFSNTSSVEMRMTRKISEVLQESVCMIAGNEPVCFYEYETPSHLPDNAKLFCNVYETLGDKRLGDHLLAGMELFLPLLLDSVVEDESAIDRLDALLREGRGVMEEEPWDTATVAECGMKVADMTVTLAAELLNESFLDTLDSFSTHPLWKETLDEARKACTEKRSFFLLAKTLGFQAGLVCRSLEENAISWGTYPDATGIHCNSHANNLVVLDPVSASAIDSQLIAPVDFDMAFTETDFRPEIVAASHQNIFPRTWSALIQWEQQMGMRTSLAGSNFTSTGVTNQQLSETSSRGLRLLSACFRDTVVAGFDAALAGKDSLMTLVDPASASALIKLSLILTIDSGNKN